ncbi:MAG: class I SAM-dependent methyltransferase [Armatimonadota bacterium]|nr:class I SAM-dependent methyltransferase [Armatimonadota bacterium]MDR7549010.1 class I SAM-dependent methyltransferase [Armatimonadota bacterium]
MSRLLAEAAAVVERVARDPAVVADVVRKAKSRLSSSRHQRRIGEYASAVEAPEVGLARLLGVETKMVADALAAEGFRRIVADLDCYQPPDRARRMGGPGFLEACYAIVRLARPAVVLETGVAHGYSTAVILQALEDNGAGRLYSVDLPRFRPGLVPYTGAAVPKRLRHRWELHLGSDRRVLPRLLARIAPVDYLFYDSDTAYEGMLHTWGLVWPYLRPGGVMTSNVVHANDAYLEFCETRGLPPLVIPQPKRHGAHQRPRRPGERIFYMGLFRKPLDG